MNEEILKEILKEIAKTPKYEVGFVEARRLVSDGQSIIGMNATDILGFAKSDNERRIRRVRGAQAWYKKMYENGWRYAGNFEYEGLLHKGFVVMERVIPNKKLEQLLEKLVEVEEPILFIPDTFKVKNEIREMNPDAYSKPLMPVREAYLKEMKEGRYDDRSMDADISPKGLALKKITLTEKGIKAKEAVDEMIKAGKVKIEGFDSEVSDFMVDAKKGMKTLEEAFFDETGKNAIWRGKETKAFKLWKEML